MFRQMALAAFSFIALGSAHAAQLESREAWLSGSSFDGTTFRYQYVAYDASQVASDEIKISCEYAQNSGKIILKAIEVKVLMQASFDQPGAQIKRTGAVDVRRAVADCQKPLPGSRNAVRSPVAIKLPQISIPSAE